LKALPVAAVAPSSFSSSRKAALAVAAGCAAVRVSLFLFSAEGV